MNTAGSEISRIVPASVPLLEMRKIVKTFLGVRALDGVDLVLRPGEIHAICGENGAGKSTLMKVLSGLYPAGQYQGEIRIDGRIHAFRGIRDAEDAGIAIIYQELALVPDLTIAENFFLGHERTKGFGILDWDRMDSEAGALLKEVGLDVPPTTRIGDLGIGQQQLVEIAKALCKKARILVLDEPTAALAEHESQALLSIMRGLRDKGVSCLLISHKQDEVFAIADSITVLRDGQSIGTWPASELSDDKVVALMVGREVNDRYPRHRRAPGEVVLEVSDLTVRDRSDPRRRACSAISFEARRGEVLGIAGLVGSGRTELVESLFGAYRGQRVAGQVRIEGRAVVIRQPADAIAHGMALVTEDRKGSGLMLDQSVAHNVTLASLSGHSRWGVVDGDSEIATTRKAVLDLKIKVPSLESDVRTLSGGNQQKVVLAKWLARTPRILFLDEPTRGIDVGAKYEIYLLIDRLVSSGTCVVMVSSDLNEVLGMSDRILVMREGRLAGEFAAEQATPETVMNCATGG